MKKKISTGITSIWTTCDDNLDFIAFFKLWAVDFLFYFIFIFDWMIVIKLIVHLNCISPLIQKPIKKTTAQQKYLWIKIKKKKNLKYDALAVIVTQVIKKKFWDHQKIKSDEILYMNECVCVCVCVFECAFEPWILKTYKQERNRINYHEENCKNGTFSLRCLK